METLGESGKIASLSLKVNSELKKCGFKKAFVKQVRIDKGTIKDELTIYFNPSFDSTIDYINRNCSRDSFFPLWEYLRDLNGCEYWSDYYSLRPNTFEEQVSLKIDLNGTSYEIGHYLPLRNVVLIYLPFKHNWEKGFDNKYILEVLEYVKKIVREYDIKGVDVTEAKEKILIAKFTEGTNSQISELERQIEGAKNDKKKFEKRLIESHRAVKLGMGSIESLKLFVIQIKEGLLKKIKEIKELKFVNSAELTGDGVEIKFKEIFIKVKDENVRMGNYTITLFPNKFKIVNENPINRSGTLYHSPHIRGPSICFGTQNTMAFELLGNLEFKKLTHFLWLYLNSYNEGDTHLPMRDWIAGRNNGDVVPTDNGEDDDDDDGEDYD